MLLRGDTQAQVQMRDRAEVAGSDKAIVDDQIHRRLSHAAAGHSMAMLFELPGQIGHGLAGAGEQNVETFHVSLLKPDSRAARAARTVWRAASCCGKT